MHEELRMETERAREQSMHACMMESNGGAHHSLFHDKDEVEAEAEAPPAFGICQLKRLFQEQQHFLDYFFKHLNYEEVSTT